MFFRPKNLAARLPENGVSWPIRWGKAWKGELLIGLFVLFQFGDIFFGSATLNTLNNTPLACHREAGTASSQYPPACLYPLEAYHGWLENSWLNRFPAGIPTDRAFWDRPLVYDPNFRAGHLQVLAGEFPWLNPHLGLGVPLFGNGVDGHFFIGNLLMLMLSAEHWDWVYLAFFTLCGIVAYRLLHRDYGLGFEASLVGALIYLSSGVFAPQMTFGGEIFNVYCFTFALYFVERFRQAGGPWGRWSSALGVSVCLAQAAYAGMPEGTVANYFMVAAYLMIRLKWSPVLALKDSVLWGGWMFGLALLLSAPYLGALLYNSQLMHFSHEVGHATIPWRYWVQTFLPYLYGWVLNPFLPPEHPNHLNVIFVGILPAIAGILGLSLGRWPRNRLWWGLGGAVLFYLSQAFGEPGRTLNVVGWVPIVNHIWFFRFFGTIYAWGLSALTAKILHEWSQGHSTMVAKRALLGLFLGGVGYWMVLREAAGTIGEHRFEFLDWNAPMTAWVFLSVLFFGMWAWRTLHSQSWQVSARVWGIALIIFTFFYHSTHFSKSFYRQHDSFALTPSLQFLKNKQAAGERFRIYSPISLFPSMAAGFGLDDLRYMIPIVPQTMLHVLENMLWPEAKGKVLWDRFEALQEGTGSALYAHPGFDWLNVRYFLFPPHDSNMPQGEGFRLVFQDERLVVIENLNAQDRFWLVPSAHVLHEEAELWQILREHPARLGEEILLKAIPSELPSLTLPAAQANEAWLRLLQQTAKGWVFQANLPHSRWLVISQTYLKGYKAWVNGQETPVFEANGGMLGLNLPAGSYEVRVEFRHPFAQITFLALGIGLVGIAISGGLYWRKRSS